MDQVRHTLVQMVIPRHFNQSFTEDVAIRMKKEVETIEGPDGTGPVSEEVRKYWQFFYILQYFALNIIFRDHLITNKENITAI